MTVSQIKKKEKEKKAELERKTRACSTQYAFVVTPLLIL